MAVFCVILPHSPFKEEEIPIPISKKGEKTMILLWIILGLVGLTVYITIGRFFYTFASNTPPRSFSSADVIVGIVWPVVLVVLVVIVLVYFTVLIIRWIFVLCRNLFGKILFPAADRLGEWLAKKLN